MGFGTRQPTSNDLPNNSNNPWGSQNDLLDDVAVLLNDLGKRCSICKRVVLNLHLKTKDGINYCPDHEPK